MFCWFSYFLFLLLLELTAHSMAELIHLILLSHTTFFYVVENHANPKILATLGLVWSVLDSLAMMFASAYSFFPGSGRLWYVSLFVRVREPLNKVHDFNSSL